MSVLKFNAVKYNQDGVDIENTLGIYKELKASEKSALSEEEFSEPADEAEEYTPTHEELLEEREKIVADKEQKLEEMRAELNKLKDQYIEQGKQVIIEAKRRAESIISDAEAEADEITENAEHERNNVFIKARKEGFEQGKKDGVAACLSEGNDILDNARKFSEMINTQKAELFAGYENEIYETVMEIANKVTLGSMAVKDGTAAKKLIKKAARDFRNSQLIRITLDDNDAYSEFVGDYEYLKELCGGVEHVEVELISGAEAGTVIVENGEEITDAGIQMQLKMIRELGNGKFRAPSLGRQNRSDKSEDETDFDENNIGDEEV